MKSYENKIKLAIELYNKGKVLDSKKILDNILNKDLNDSFLTNFYGLVCLELHLYADAEKFLKISYERNPSNPEVNLNLGLLNLKKKDFISAKFFFENSINFDEKYEKAYQGLAISNESLLAKEEVIFFYKECIKKFPNNFFFNINLSIFYQKIGLENNSFSELLEAEKKDSNSSVVLLNFGIFYKRKKDFNKAKFYFKKAAKIDLNSSEIFFHLADIFFLEGNLPKAIEISDKVYFKDQDFENNLVLRSLIFKKIGKLDEALSTLEICVKKFNNSRAIVIIIGILCEVLRHDEANYYYSLIKEKILQNNYELSFDDIQTLIFYSNYITNFDNNDFFLYDLLNSKYFNLYSDKKKNIELNKKKKIILGFISGDVLRHAVFVQLYEFFNELSKYNDFEIILFNNSSKKDDLTTNIENFFKKTINIFSEEDLLVHKKIKDCNIDILFDLSGFTTGNRLGVFYLRSAPIQISWCGYLASTRIKNIDYIISDKYCIPEDENNKYLEKILRLKSFSLLSFYENLTLDSYTKNENDFIYGYFGSLNKLNINLINLWIKILNGNTKSKIYLKSASLKNSNLVYYNKLFKDLGLKEDQLILEIGSNRADLLRTYKNIDLSLDSFPYSGGTTSFESIYMGVPVLTKKGFNFISRSTQSINYNLGLEDLIAKDDEDYVAKAINFSLHTEYLKKIKKRIILEKENNIIFSAKNYVQDFAINIKKIYSEF